MVEQQHEPFEQECLESEVIASYLEGRLSGAQREAVELHLATCDDCRELTIEAFDVKTALDEKHLNQGERSEAPVVAEAPPISRQPHDVAPGAPSKSYLLGPWRRAIGLTGLLAAAAAALFIVQLDPAWLQTLRGGARGASPEFRALVTAASGGPSRYVEPRLTGGFGWAPPPPTFRSANTSSSLPPDLRMAIAGVEHRAQHDSTPETQHALGISLLIAGREDDAVKTLEHVSEARPEDAAVQNDLAAAYLTRAAHQGLDADAARALRAATRATELAPSSAEAWFNLALARDVAGQPAQARVAWTRAATLERDAAWRTEANRHVNP